jgi:hypothetical protein
MEKLINDLGAKIRKDALLKVRENMDLVKRGLITEAQLQEYIATWILDAIEFSGNTLKAIEALDHSEYVQNKITGVIYQRGYVISKGLLEFYEPYTGPELTGEKKKSIDYGSRHIVLNGRG